MLAASTASPTRLAMELARNQLVEYLSNSELHKDVEYHSNKQTQLEKFYKVVVAFVHFLINIDFGIARLGAETKQWACLRIHKGR